MKTGKVLQDIGHGIWKIFLMEGSKTQTLVIFPGEKDPRDMSIEELRECPRLYRDVSIREALGIFGEKEVPKGLWRRSGKLSALINKKSD